MLAILGVILLSIESGQLGYDNIMNSFGFNPDLLKFNIKNPFKNRLKNLTGKFDLEPEDKDDVKSEAEESEFDDNVSDIDPNDYITEMDSTVNNDIDKLVNSYLNEDAPPATSTKNDEHLTSEQLAKMFDNLQS